MKGTKKMARNIVLGLLILGVIIFIIHMADGFIRGKKLYTVEVPVVSSKINSELDGYKVAFVTDVHKMSDKKLEELRLAIEKESPDLIMLGGDFGGKDYTKNALEMLGKIKTPDGIYGVQGNHDNSRRLFGLMKENDITVLDNSGEQIRPGFYLGGVEDYETRNSDIDKAVEHAQDDDFVMLISHNADLSMKQSTEKIDMMVSGHTHGGEVNFFGVWSPALTMIGGKYGVTEYGQRFMQGWCKSADDKPVYVSSGVGSHMGFRIFSPAELTIFILESE